MTDLTFSSDTESRNAETLQQSYDTFPDFPPLTQTTTIEPGNAVEEPCFSQFLRFLAVAQVAGTDFLFFDWKENVLARLGEGATGDVRQSPLSIKSGFAFKTFRKSDAPRLEQGTYKALIAEVLVLCHSGIQEHPNIVNLYGVTFHVVSTRVDGEMRRRVWPVLVLERSSHGNLETYFETERMPLAQAILVAYQIGSAIKEMHLAGKSEYPFWFASL